MHPLRVWLLAPRTNGYTGDISLAAPLGTFFGANIQVNGVNFLKNPINSRSEWYSILREQFPGADSSDNTGGLVSYPEFVGTYNLNCFDLRRLHERIAPGESVSLAITATRPADGLNCDYYYVVERLQCVTFNISSGAMEVIVGLPRGQAPVPPVL